MFSDRPEDGSQPKAGLAVANGKLYGTTLAGGVTGYGTIFSASISGKERVLHSFGYGYAHDGIWPAASLIDANGALYGTMSGGVSLARSGSEARDYGTVFAWIL